MRSTTRSFRAPLFGAAAVLLLAGCSGLPGSTPPPDPSADFYDGHGSLTGGDGAINIFGGRTDDRSGVGSGIGVNAFLWRASLDTFAFLPPFSADPMGGVIIYDWYAPAETPNERLKVTVYILDTRLRADAVRVKVFRQLRGADGEWRDAAVEDGTNAALEDAILTRARQLRIAQLGQ